MQQHIDVDYLEAAAAAEAEAYVNVPAPHSTLLQAAAEAATP
jgi:hypothetical protein